MGWWIKNRWQGRRKLTRIIRLHQNFPFFFFDGRYHHNNKKNLALHQTQVDMRENVLRSYISQDDGHSGPWIRVHIRESWKIWYNLVWLTILSIFRNVNPSRWGGVVQILGFWDVIVRVGRWPCLGSSQLGCSNNIIVAPRPMTIVIWLLAMTPIIM